MLATRVSLPFYKVGDFEPITDLIDGYDNLFSDAMNEFDKFANAYLRLVGQIHSYVTLRA